MISQHKKWRYGKNAKLIYHLNRIEIATILTLLKDTAKLISVEFHCSRINVLNNTIL